jgi:hypothetical protein
MTHRSKAANGHGRSRTLLPTMTVLPEPPEAMRPAAAGLRALDLGPAAIASALAVTGGTALLGLLAGYAWSVLAPRAALVMVSPGAAALVQVETRAFIAADAVFCLLTVAGGVISGALGYLLAVRRHGPLAMAGVLAGAIAAACLARWVGERSGLAGFHHLLATLHAGARLRDTLTLGASSALAFWPLAAGLIAGGLTALAADGRRGRPGAP